METNEEELRKLSQSMYNAAELLYRQGEITAAVTLYFKSLFICLDAQLLQIAKRKPKDHIDRFAMLSKYLPTEYFMLDRLFPIYRKTYSKGVEPYNVIKVRNYVSEKISQYFRKGSEANKERESFSGS